MAAASLIRMPETRQAKATASGSGPHQKCADSNAQTNVDSMSKREQRLKAEVGAFIRQYARKRYPGMDPNDRRHDREIEQLIRRMKPEQLDALMRAGENDPE